MMVCTYIIHSNQQPMSGQFLLYLENEAISINKHSEIEPTCRAALDSNAIVIKEVSIEATSENSVIWTSQ